ncbi:LOW QUALITY PROTEIN: NADH dehydrogenase [ubiquinone] 1 alpha subcomplex subunit 8-like [Gigantopelta aegis]|uniref:LOW QUALITY PROTEIN: NADH dehydrogenase [ubiquinone] 1 alpha subcomplex subunit 8-like n=1 Tax=Gigantopelta aegis TaxID=1735272 RepID=UPI001B88B48D|nr:LOW QUALITY PROTEIN: NADH dehydrogenase [ubiquinone] 1 alpha subcomplex subunit 8-like [Gigantopelta aegis]
MGAAHHYGTYCKTKNDAFMQCRIEGNDPRKCLQEGKESKGSCNEVFTEHWTCLDYNNQEHNRCRKTQKSFDSCMNEKLNLKRDS